MKYLETIKSIDGELQHLSYHQKRLDNTLKNHSYKLSKIIIAPKKGTYRCRMIYDSDSFEVTYHTYRLNIAKSFKIVYADTLDYHLKYADRKELENLKNGYDEILIVKNSLITDTTIANVAFLKNGRWFTPKKPLLKGTTRMRLIDEGFLHVQDISIDDIDRYEGFGVMNALTGFQIIENGIMSLKK